MFRVVTRQWSTIVSRWSLRSPSALRRRMGNGSPRSGTEVPLTNVAHMQIRPARMDRREVDLSRLIPGFLRTAPDVAIVGEVRDRAIRVTPPLDGRLEAMPRNPERPNDLKRQSAYGVSRRMPLHRPSESSLKAQYPPDIAQVNGSRVRTLLSGQWR